MAIGVGEPWLGRLPDGGFDPVPILVSAGVLVVARACRLTITWTGVALAVLAGPPLVALAQRIGAPLTAWIVIVGLGAVGRVRRRSAGHTA